MNRLLIFAKYPEPGKVKTRLAQSIGDIAAASLYRQMLQHVVLNTTPQNGEYTQVLYFDPPGRRERFRRWFPQIKDQFPQWGDALGPRLHHAIHTTFRQGASKVAVIGSDCLDFDRNTVTEVFKKLSTSDLVIGPAQDGGYYLLGCRRLHPELLQGISWSTDRVFEQTLERAKNLRLTISLLAQRSDIDHLRDLNSQNFPLSEVNDLPAGLQGLTRKG